MAATSTLRLRIFDGSRQLFAAAACFLVTISDGNQTEQVREYYTQNDLAFTLPFFDNLGDDYTVLVWAEGYRQAGFTPVHLSNTYTRTLDIMLVSDSPGFNFAPASWAKVKATYPFVAAGESDAAGENRYNALLEQQPKTLACLLNLGEAMSQIQLSQFTPVPYLKQMIWDAPFAPAQDRFFAWCDVELINQVKVAAAAGLFAVENDPGLLHPGATSSWKQVRFGEANVQLTFHENNRSTIDGVECVIVEPDMDYYRDPLAHILLEVIPNELTGTLTDPVMVYVLRWIAGQTAGLSQFAPLYTIT